MGWDRLRACLMLERELGDFRVGAAGFGHWDSVPRLMKVSKGHLYRVPGHHVERDLEKTRYAICDICGNGAVIYLPEVFRSGCNFDPQHFVASEHIDLALQMLKQGYLAIHITDPLAPHQKKRCSPPEYEAVRLGDQQKREAWQKLVDKWGLNDVGLYKNVFGKFPDGTEEVFRAGGPEVSEEF
jgi:hypothetical protein